MEVKAEAYLEITGIPRQREENVTHTDTTAEPFDCIISLHPKANAR